MKLQLIVCENYINLYREVSKEFKEHTIRLVSYKCNCIHKNVESCKLNGDIHIEKDMVTYCITSKYCQFINQIKDSNWSIITLNTCMEQVLQKNLIEYFAQNRKYVVTDDWLNNWRSRIEELGFRDQKSVSDFFKGFSDEIIVIGTDEAGRSLDLAEFLDCKISVVNLGKDIVRNRIQNILEGIEKDTLLKDHNNEINGLRKQLAEKVMMLVVLNKLNGILSDEEIIEKVQTLWKIIFGIQEVEFYSQLEDHSKEVSADSESVVIHSVNNGHSYGKWRLSGFKEKKYVTHYQKEIDLINKSFCVAMERNLLVKQLKLSQAQIIHQEKMASLGELAAGLAHEINNPLSFINGNVSVFTNYVEDVSKFLTMVLDDNNGAIRKRYASELDNMDYILEDTHELLEEIFIGVDRINKIISRFRGFTNIDRVNAMAYENLEAILEDVIFMFNSNYHDILRIHFKPSQIPLVYLNRGEISVTLYDIMNNSLEAIQKKEASEKGDIIIEVYEKDAYVFITIKDNGIGISKEIQQKIYNPFFTTKEIGEGVGLGLTFAYDVIVNRHQGSLNIESNEKGQTICEIGLPIKG